MRFATVVSRVFEPSIVLGVILVLAGVRSGLTIVQTLLWGLVFVAPPTILRWWAAGKRGLDWDIHDRKRRIVPLVILFVFILADMLLLRLFSVFTLADLFFLFLVWTLGFLVITTCVTKISGHTSCVALATGLIVSWFGWGWWPILLIVPLVAWSRVVRRDHTVPQVIMGALYSWVLLVVFDYWIITSFL